MGTAVVCDSSSSIPHADYITQRPGLDVDERPLVEGIRAVVGMIELEYLASQVVNGAMRRTYERMYGGDFYY